MKRALLILLLLLPATLGYVDLATPTNNTTHDTTPAFSYYHNTTTTCTLTAGPSTTTHNATDGVNTITNVTLPDGTHQWHVTCANHTSDERTITIDTTPPNITLTTPINEELTGFNYNVNDTTPTTCTATIANTTVNTTPINYEPPHGTHQWNVTCIDAAGNTKTSNTATFTKSPYTLTLGNTNIQSGDRVQVTVNAPTNATATLRVCPDTGGYTNCYIALQTDQPYPHTEYLPQNNNTGSYILEATFTNGNYQLERRAVYTVTNNLDVTIDADTEIYADDDLELRADATGGVTPITYTWKLPNGTTRTGQRTTLELPQGTHDITVTATDNAGHTSTATHQVNVIKTYEVTIQVTNSQTDQPIRGALVELGNRETRTRTEGYALFNTPKDTYTLTTFKDQYELYKRTITINKQRTITIPLEPKNATAATITQTEPKQRATAGTITFSFDTTATDCTINLRGDADKQLPAPNNQATTTLGPGQYYWRVTCAGATSDERSLLVQQHSYDTSTQKNKVENILETLTPDEQQALRRVGEYDTIKDTLDALRRAGRDLHDIDYKTGLSASEKEQRRNTFLNDLNTQYNNTVRDVTINDATTVVHGPSDDALTTVADALNRSVDTLRNAQNAVVIETTATPITTTQIDGDQTTYTIVEKTIRTKAAGIFADPVTPRNAPRSDGIYTYNTTETTYVLNGSHDPPSTVYVPPQQDTKATGYITNVPAPDTKTTLLVIAALLLIVYYYTDNDDTIRDLIRQTHDELDNENYRSAHEHYNTVKRRYEALPKREQAKHGRAVRQLITRINEAYTDHLTNTIDDALANHDYTTANTAYAKLRNLYTTLDDNAKHIVYDKLKQYL